MTTKKKETPFSQGVTRKRWGLLLILGRFQFDTRGNIFTMRATRHWNNLPIGSQRLDTFKIQKDRVLGHLVKTKKSWIRWSLRLYDSVKIKKDHSIKSQGHAKSVSNAKKPLWNDRHAEDTVFIDNKRISEIKCFILGFSWFRPTYTVRCICDSKKKICVQLFIRKPLHRVYLKINFA